MKGIGPNNLGMSKSSVSSCCGIPGCDHNSSAAQFNSKLESQAMQGNLPEEFGKAVMENKNKNKSSAPLKKKGCKGY